MAEETKRCPYCDEEIRARAVKCKHCGAMLDESVPAPSAPDPLDSHPTIPPGEIKSILGGRYELLEELGRGGMGIVYKALDTKLDTVVAIKLLPEYLARDNRGINILKREALAAMKLSHPNIMKFYHFEDHPEGKFLIVEYIEGKTLDQILDESPGHALPEEQVIKYAVEACKGLEYAHSEGVIHRDIKPSNIMVDVNGRVKITDFGIARVLKDSHTRHTGTVTSGTLLYMSPEQIQGEKCDARSDIYSFGISLYELLSGNAPFSSGDITHQHINKMPAPIPDISDRLNAILVRCLEKKPEDRFRSAGELADALAGRMSAETTEGSKAAQKPHEPLSVKPGMSRAWVVAMLFLIVALIGGAVAYRYVQAGKADDEASGVRAQPPDSNFRKLTPEEVKAMGLPLPGAEPARPVMEQDQSGDDTSSQQPEEAKKKEAEERAEEQSKAGEEERRREELEKQGLAQERETALTQAVVEVKVAMEASLEAAKRAEAPKHASSEFNVAEQERKKAAEYDQRGNRELAKASYEKAKAGYDKSVQSAKQEKARIEAERVAKQKAEAESARSEMAAAKSRAESEEALKFAGAEYEPALTSEREASNSFISGSYVEAKAKYISAKDGYLRALNLAKQIRAEMILVPAGEFMMGSPSGKGAYDEYPQHRVYVDAFYMDEYEVTMSQYMAFIRATGHRGLPDWVSKYAPSDNCPVVGVSWDDAVAYAQWVGKRLPTEAEWEYACRAGSAMKYSFGNDEGRLGEYAWYDKNSGGKTHPVGQKKPNNWGLYDMHGNVWEWCSDWHDSKYYQSSPSKNPKGPANGRYRVLRGGSWGHYASYIRSAYRDIGTPVDTRSGVGFRCAKDIKNKQYPAAESSSEEVENEEAIPKPSARYALQVSSSQDKALAYSLVEILGVQGYESYVEETALDSASGTWFRVMVGPFQAREEAEAVLRTLNKDSRFAGLYLRYLP